MSLKKKRKQGKSWFHRTLTFVHRIVIVAIAITSATLVIYHLWQLLEPIRNMFWVLSVGA